MLVAYINKTLSTKITIVLIIQHTPHMNVG